MRIGGDLSQDLCILFLFRSFRRFEIDEMLRYFRSLGIKSILQFFILYSSVSRGFFMSGYVPVTPCDLRSAAFLRQDKHKQSFPHNPGKHASRHTGHAAKAGQTLIYMTIS